MEITVDRPRYGSLPVKDALTHDWSGYDLSEKMDGVWHELRIGQSVIVGELMRDGRFFAFDVAVAEGQDIRLRPKRERLAILASFPLARPATPQPGEAPARFIQRILGRGGEGVVAAALDGPFGYDVCKIKRVETFDCVVVEKINQSIRLTLNGEPAGNCALLGRSYDLVQVGDVVELAAFCRLASGKFREPRFIRVRPDKAL